jgi:hypothetical protein
MSFFRKLLQNLLSFIERFEAKDACALLCAAGLNNFEIGRLLYGDESDEIDSDGRNSLLEALCLEDEHPVGAWKGQEFGGTFLWKRESDLGVRDWIYLS